MEHFKVYGLNLSAILISIVPSINENLQTVVLMLTIIYTIIRIFKTTK